MNKNVLKFFGFPFLFWMIYFTVGRMLFLLYNAESNVSILELFSVFSHAIHLDTATAFYMLIPLFLYWITSLFIPLNRPLKFLIIYFAISISILTLITVTDLEVYNIWGVKLNANALSYLQYPKEAFASSLSSPLAALFFFWVILVCGFFWLSKKIALHIPGFSEITSGLRFKSIILNIAVGIFGLTVFIIGMRGGTQLTPINQSFVYFSEKAILNHAAVNTGWNLLSSYTGQNGKNPYTFFPEDTALVRFQSLYHNNEKFTPQKILTVNHPNIVLILLEGFVSEIFSSMGGSEKLTPNLDNLVKEGLSFENIYASGNRTDRGLVAILSGYPSQPKSSIIKEPDKTKSLPFLSKILKDTGYYTSFYYGGESEFSNIKSYLYHAGYDTIIDKNQFSTAQLNSKWGVHDHILLNKILSDLSDFREPFFTTILTLSSHEPYEVPMETVITGNSRRSKYKNSVIYTDQSIGHFMDKVRQTPYYKNTVFIFISDHGYHLQEGDTYRWPRHYHIPFFITGEPLNKKWQGKKIPKVGSQVDLTATLLPLLHLDASQFKFGKNLFHPKINGFAYYSVNEGLAWVTHDQNLIYDYPSNKTLFFNSLITDSINQNYLNDGKAFLQILFDDYLNR